jgi:hypothetical protein
MCIEQALRNRTKLGAGIRINWAFLPTATRRAFRRPYLGQLGLFFFDVEERDEAGLE